MDLNATKAAIRAGYSRTSAEFQGSKLLADRKISQEIATKQAKQLERTDLTAVRVLEELRRLSFSDVRSLFDGDGNLVPLQNLTPEQAACIASVEVVIKNAKAGDGQTDTIHKIKVWDKPRSLEMLAKHFGLLIEKVEHSGGMVFRWQA